jgi:hypothetical protein
VRPLIHQALREYSQSLTGSNPWQPSVVRAFTFKVFMSNYLETINDRKFSHELMVDVALKRIVSTDAGSGLALKIAT